ARRKWSGSSKPANGGRTIANSVPSTAATTTNQRTGPHCRATRNGSLCAMADRAMDQRAPNLPGVRGPVSTLVIIPAFYEEDALPGTLSELMSLRPDLDIVVVSDGSIDKTAA